MTDREGDNCWCLATEYAKPAQVFWSVQMKRPPTLFISHCAPTFALEPGLAGANLAALGQRLLRPQAVLVVSPHLMKRQPYLHRPRASRVGVWRFKPRARFRR